MIGFRKEQQRSNILLNANSPGTAPWTVVNGSIVDASSYTPDGYGRLSSFNEVAGAGNWEIYQPSTVGAASVNQTASCLVRARERFRCRLYWVTGAYVNGCNATFDLKRGTVDSAVSIGSGVLYDARMAYVGNGIWLISVSGKIDVVSTVGYFVFDMLDSNGASGYVGVLNNGMFVGACQVEEGTVPTTRVETFGSIVTRLADQLIFPPYVLSDGAGSLSARYQCDNWVFGLVAAQRIFGQLIDYSTPLFLPNAPNVSGSYDGTSQIQGPIGMGALPAVGGATWGASKYTCFAAGLPGTGASYNAAYDGTMGLSSGVGIGVSYSLDRTAGWQGVISNVEVYGRRLSDTAMTQFPVDAAQEYAVGDNLNDPQVAWSDNPAVILADFISSTAYGANRAVDWPTAAEAAAYCDEQVGGEARNKLTIFLDTKRTVGDWINTIRPYIPAWVSYEDKAYIIADKPRSTIDHVFDASNISAAPEPFVAIDGVRDVPNEVAIGFTRTNVTPWASDFVSTVRGSPVIRRRTRVDMPGIRRETQANRMAAEQLNRYYYENMAGQISVFDPGISVRIGDRCIVDLDEQLGVLADARVVGVSNDSHGRWTVAWRKYDVRSFSDMVLSSTVTPNTNLPNPRIVPAATSLVMTEQVYQDSNVTATGYTMVAYKSRWAISWAASLSAYPVQYRVQLFDGTRVVDERLIAGLSYFSPPIQQGLSYTVSVYARNSLGFESPVLANPTPLLALGKFLKPGNVPRFTTALALGNEILLAWDAAIDIDISRYIIKAQAPGSYSWATATVLDTPDVRFWRYKGMSPGTYRFGIKAIDSVGQESLADLTTDLVVAADSNAFLQTFSSASPTLSNMLAYNVEGDPATKYVTQIAGDQWQTKEPNPLNSGANPIASYHTNGTSSFRTEAWNLGSAVAGSFGIVPDLNLLAGSVAYEIETSPDNAVWTTVATTQTWTGSCPQYIRGTIKALTTSSFKLNRPLQLTLAAVTRRESSDPSAPVAVAAAGTTTINLTGKYTKLVALDILVSGTTGVFAVYSNIVLGAGTNSFDVKCFNNNNAQAAGNITWKVEGY